MTKEKKEEGEEGAAPAGKGRRKSPGQGRRESRRPATKRPRPSPKPSRREEEIIFAAQTPLSPRMETCASHRGFGQSGRGIREDAPQRRFFAGRKTGGAVEMRIGRTSGSFSARIAKAERDGKTDFAVRAADVHEFERRNGRGAGEFLPVAAGADFGGGGRCGFAVGRNPAARRAAAAAGIMDWSPSSSIWRRASLRGCGSGSDARTARGRSRITCSADLMPAESAVAGKSFGTGGRPG